MFVAIVMFHLDQSTNYTPKEGLAITYRNQTVSLCKQIFDYQSSLTQHKRIYVCSAKPIVK